MNPSERLKAIFVDLEDQFEEFYTKYLPNFANATILNV